MVNVSILNFNEADSMTREGCISAKRLSAKKASQTAMLQALVGAITSISTTTIYLNPRHPTAPSRYRIPKLKTNFTSLMGLMRPVLCEGQANPVGLFLRGRNVFYTGSAGCGVSTILKALVECFAEIGLNVQILVPIRRATFDTNSFAT
ncbi:hypothetical protein CC78DRAFT_616774 [Lojkania enalia]|uniref:Uncharacterized protein n=1 Tax=Lojkania enalia TaxID=147567 RepID=A0A9P4N454_9PLEO|nr:hypothetical protein CC78DRAFT_616774 [Didymosphaeria enalia]